MSDHQVTITIHGARGEEWEHVLGTRTLPVKYPHAENCDLEGAGVTPCFLLDVEALTEEQQERVIDHLARKFHAPIADVASDVHSVGVPIRDGLDVQVHVPPGYRPVRRVSTDGRVFDLRMFT